MDNLRDTCATFGERFIQIPEAIEDRRQRIEPYADEVDLAQKILPSDPDLEETLDELAPGTENENNHDKDRQVPIPDTDIEDYHIVGDLGLVVSTSDSNLHDFNEMPDESYREHMRKLNDEQITFLSDTIYILKTSSKPFFKFLSGEAGHGKSCVIQALYQTALRFLNKYGGDDFSIRRIFLVAPTFGFDHLSFYS